MIAAAILLVAILGLLTLYINTMFMSEANRNMVISANDAQYVLEQIKGLLYTDIPGYVAPELDNLGSSEQISVTLSSVGTNITQVTVNVRWTERGRAKNFQLSTRIAK